MRDETNGGTNVPAMKRVNPFELYGQLYGGENFFEGDFVKLSQDDGWVRGSEKEPIDKTEMFAPTSWKRGMVGSNIARANAPKG
jgi:hypothetical protein